MMRYFIYISYLGTSYSGWQIQNNAISIQQVVQHALRKVLGTPLLSIVGSSRTEKGVHAKQQVAHFDVDDPIDTAQLTYASNRILPSDVSIHKICPVIDQAHARFDALYRVYEYTILDQKDPFYKDTSIWMGHLPSLDVLNQIATQFCIEADFEYFSKVNKQADNFVCTIEEAVWSYEEGKTLFRIKSNRFLRGMVRAIVAIMLKVGMGKMDMLTLQKMVAKTQRVPLPLVPACGLTLVEVGFSENLFIK